MKVLLTGGTGLIGKEIGKALVRANHQVVVISRDENKAKLNLPYPCTVIEADLSKSSAVHPQFAEIDAVIHLAGENVGEGRWSKDRKEKILRSRTELTKNLIQSLTPAKNLKVFISASAVGIYGDRGNESLSESSKPGQGFLADVCKQWEDSLNYLDLNFGAGHLTGIRKVILRTGVVFSAFGGALEKMVLPFRAHMGGALGSGNQWISWIHIDDLVKMYMQALADENFAGVYNAVSPSPVTNSELNEEIAKVLGQSTKLKAPAIALKLALGEMSHVVLDSQKVFPKNLEKEKFRFQFADITAALRDCLKYVKDGNLVIHSEQYLPAKREKIFPFFADAHNLEEITPALLNFKIEKVSTKEVGMGTLIDYSLKIRGVPAKWKTEIREWVPGEKFVDYQLMGPYSLWHHTHTFEDLGPGTLMSDTVLYKLPLGIIGWAFAGKLVQNDVEKIFSYRRGKVYQIILDKYDG